MKRSLAVLAAAACVTLAACGSSSGNIEPAAPTAPAAAPAAETTAPPAPTTHPSQLALEAHDGEIVQDGGTYVLYGTSYACGFALLDYSTPWCGIRAYTSTDLTNWADRGLMFDPAAWQSRCAEGAFGCFRPHVAQRPDGTWVMWMNVADGQPRGFGVLTAPTPLGPWTEAPAPHLAINLLDHGAWGDLDLQVDSQGGAWLAYTAVGEGNSHDIAIERLTPDYLSGTGDVVMAGLTMVEAPALFVRGGIWYLTYSDPACPYCGGTGTGYVTAPSPLGPWTAQGQQISADSCSGQPAAVNTLTVGGQDVFLYQSDQWVQKPEGGFEPNQTAATTFLEPLQFATDGSILPVTCAPSWIG